jgi:hypothetical protein
VNASDLKSLRRDATAGAIVGLLLFAGLLPILSAQWEHRAPQSLGAFVVLGGIGLLIGGLVGLLGSSLSRNIKRPTLGQLITFQAVGLIVAGGLFGAIFGPLSDSGSLDSLTAIFAIGVGLYGGRYAFYPIYQLLRGTPAAETTTQ